VPAPHADKLVCFAVSGQEFGLPIRAVKETLPMRPVTRLHLVPRFVAGLINLRGDVVAVLDLGGLVGLDGGRGADGAIVVLRAAERPLDPRASARALCGLVVERLLGVRELDGELAPPPPTLAAEAASYLRGVAAVDDPPHPLNVLDPERLLASERLRPFRRGRPKS
jgi:purine-binding chemotaxis protein CheW